MFNVLSNVTLTLTISVIAPLIRDGLDWVSKARSILILGARYNPVSVGFFKSLERIGPSRNRNRNKMV